MRPVVEKMINGKEEALPFPRILNVLPLKVRHNFSCSAFLSKLQVDIVQCNQALPVLALPIQWVLSELSLMLFERSSALPPPPKWEKIADPLRSNALRKFMRSYRLPANFNVF